MRFRPLAILGASLALAGVTYVGRSGAGPLPPLGPFLDPVRGAWGAVAYAALPDSALHGIPGLGAAVEVRYDTRGVPHIFAASEEDAARALGFVVARDRLFQMEVQARSGAGTLTELVGAAAVSADSEARHLGMPRGAEQKLAAFPADSRSRRLLEAYAGGVNAYIDGASPAEWPVEYKLLGRRPARWLPLHSLNLYASMGATLALLNGERDRLAARAVVGDLAARALFPVESPIQEPIQPNGSATPRLDVLHLPPPGAQDSAALALLPLLPRGAPPGDDAEVSRHFASNNWAVAPARSRSGHALLAGDPHLSLTLPSIWYEAHLVVPGVLDVYGVTIPGSPGVVIGFTRDVAWSLTNTGADVLDYYRETVDDQASPRRYMLDNAWRDLERREEVYRGKVGQVLRVDTVLYSHRGPLQRLNNEWVSMRWTVNEPSDLVAAFFDAQRATTASQFLDLFARSYFAPAQNVIAADRAGNIAIRSTGHFPLRPEGGDGLAIRDGSTSASDWSGYWPVTSYPQSLNPAQGFLASANQQPIDPQQAPAYLGYDAAYEPWRALQINRLLRANGRVTLDDMRAYQTDPGSVRADWFVTYFRSAASVSLARGNAPAALKAADSLLAAWDRRYTIGNTGALLFETALSGVARRTWDELLPPGDSVRAATPSSGVLFALMADSASVWWDDRRTGDVVEDRDMILAAALASAYETLARQHGAPSSGKWAWGTSATAQVNHLLGLAGFSARDIPVQGGRGTLNPSVQNGAYGSSWRMVVELGPTVRALGTYPGGQSGNPASSRYADRLRFWKDGDLELLIVPVALDSLTPSQVQSRLTLTPAGR
ncbi:MAG: penicillin acylase family protein [Gemmatimonadaceae bacterium]|nr:penicillin acylase family protein [Gemmatimonadaceae bacterium]